MRVFVRLLAASVAPLALAIWFLCQGGTSLADEKENKEARDAVVKMADSVDKGDADAVKKQVAALKDMDLLPVMVTLKKREKDGTGGLGMGPKPGAYNPDGIEAQLQGLAKKELLPAALDKQAADIIRAANVMVAVADVALTKCPVNKKMGDKDPKDWAQWSQDMKDAAQQLADAAKAKDTKKLKTAANKLNASCNNCHGPFRAE
jgi:cytochrome c556